MNETKMLIAVATMELLCGERRPTLAERPVFAAETPDRRALVHILDTVTLNMSGWPEDTQEWTDSHRAELTRARLHIAEALHEHNIEVDELEKTIYGPLYDHHKVAREAKRIATLS